MAPALVSTVFFFDDDISVMHEPDDAVNRVHRERLPAAAMLVARLVRDRATTPAVPTV